MVKQSICHQSISILRLKQLLNCHQTILLRIQEGLGECSGWITQLVDCDYINITRISSSYMQLSEKLRNQRKVLIT